MARVPDRSLALEKYRRGIASYDESNRYRRLRANSVAHLDLRPGDHVLDVACGTGLNFSLIQEAIGQHGRLIGVDLSPDMLAIARERASKANSDQVTLIHSAVEEAQLPDRVDAALFCLTHDVMRSPAALENVMRSVKKGGAGGCCWFKMGPAAGVVCEHRGLVRGAPLHNYVRRVLLPLVAPVSLPFGYRD